MDLCSAVHCLQPVFHFLAPHARSVINFDENINELKGDLERLKAKRADEERKVKIEENKGRERLHVVGFWLSETQTVIDSTTELVDTATNIRESISTQGYLSRNAISAYSCGKNIRKKLVEITRLSSQELPAELTRQATPDAFVKQPTPKIVGLQQLDSTWSLVEEADTRILGLYGMGGVGKTTLLYGINKKFEEVMDKFNVVIWVTVSKNADIGRIQDDIGKRLGLYDEEWGKQTQEAKRGDICSNLTSKKPKFVLLMDDLWEPVSFTKIGIPLLQGGKYKIVFTTRSKQVSRKMGANKEKEVECLGEEEALELLMPNARRDMLSGDMLDILKKIAKRCQGLPLALTVIGKCLSSRRNEADWSGVLDDLSFDPDVLEGMEENFGVLKVSYDYLKNEDAQSCFKYCALFSMAYNITQDELVEYWIGEGIIDLNRGRGRAKKQGGKIINTLVEASLLLLEDDGKVHMHNMIREMALWIASEVKDGKRFLVQTDAGLKQLPSIDDRSSVTKMSLMNNKIESITHSSPQFPNLVTLFLQNNKLEKILGGFFLVLSSLVVLDLSRNLRIKELPNDISNLVSLRYLNLSGTMIKNLEGLIHLIRLIHLDLESTSNVRSLSVISVLKKLQVLRFYGSAPLNRSLLESLEEDFNDLHLLTITVRELDALGFFLGSDKLRSCTQGLHLEGLQMSGKSFAAISGDLPSLSKLGMTECDIIEMETEWRRNMYSPSTSSSHITPSNTWFRNLSAVVLISCEHLKDVTWLIYAEKLESLSIRISPKMEELISKEKAPDDIGNVEPFQKLQVLALTALVELTNIYWSPLSFPRLQKVDITNCPKLRKFPLNPTSVRKLDDLIIKTEEGWRMELKSDSVL